MTNELVYTTPTHIKSPCLVLRNSTGQIGERPLLLLIRAGSLYTALLLIIIGEATVCIVDVWLKLHINMTLIKSSTSDLDIFKIEVKLLHLLEHDSKMMILLESLPLAEGISATVMTCVCLNVAIGFKYCNSWRSCWINFIIGMWIHLIKYKKPIVFCEVNHLGSTEVKVW